MTREKIFTMDTSGIKFGNGSTEEAGYEAKRLGLKKVLVLTDRNIENLNLFQIVQDSLVKYGVNFSIYNDVVTEPTDTSFKNASKFASDDDFDGFIAVGGGSVMDTAKAANLYSTYPADFLDYVNAPIGKGIPIPGPLKPLICIPTTAGTGSETTGGAIFDLEEMHAKTGLSDRYLRPSVGIIDPENSSSMPKMVAACSGFDVLSHGIESFTAKPFDQREYSDDPNLRPAYQGSNPISDIWATSTIKMVAENIVESTLGNNEIPREKMMLAASAAGVGFGNAGVHLPHGMSYAVSGNVKEFALAGYPEGKPLIPHGLSVIINAPAVFRFTAKTSPQRHLEAAKLLGVDVTNESSKNAGNLISNKLIEFIKKLGMPNGLRGLGYQESDIENLVEGTLPQHRVTKLSPVEVGPKELRTLFEESFELW